MARKKISLMTPASAYTGADELYELVQGGNTVQGSHALLKAYFDTLYAATGSVLQEVTATDAGGTTTSTSLANVNAANISITPKSANSILIVDVQFQGVEPLLSGTNTTAYFRLYETTAAANVGEENNLTASAESQGVRIETPSNIRARVANSALTTRTFQLRARTSHAGAAAGATKMVWSIREIQG